MSAILLDTGPLVALLDASDSSHAFVQKQLGDLKGRVVTTAAIVTEAMFLLHDLRSGPDRLVRFLEDLQTEIAEVFDSRSLQVAASLMERYRDTPMDFADATLVMLAERLNCPDILTLDERGFRTFRYGRNRRFRLVLQD
ncbi:MAG: PIN domain-containing protein [Chthoniobacterales bacterium]|nr:PIN domain-containing protein [Chthoniobacterales bacterium]